MVSPTSFQERRLDGAVEVQGSWMLKKRAKSPSIKGKEFTCENISQLLGQYTRSEAPFGVSFVLVKGN